MQRDTRLQTANTARPARDTIARATRPRAFAPRRSSRKWPCPAAPTRAAFHRVLLPATLSQRRLRAAGLHTDGHFQRQRLLRVPKKRAGLHAGKSQVSSARKEKINVASPRLLPFFSLVPSRFDLSFREGRRRDRGRRHKHHPAAVAPWRQLSAGTGR